MVKEKQTEVLATSDLGSVIVQQDGAVALRLGFVSLCLSEAALSPLSQLLQEATRAQGQRRQRAKGDVHLFLCGKI